MNSISDQKLAKAIKTGLLGAGIIMLLVSIKLLLSYFVPGLKTSGELILSGILLLIYTIKTLTLYSRVKREMSFE
ncbi:hypothetical protein H8E88_27075 [candidate division KSB1 bacterium]|nr:hypothetical protein [candidate division KSB1 bacterium]